MTIYKFSEFTVMLLFSHLVLSNSLWPHELQHSRLPCPSLSPEFAQTHVHWVGDDIQLSHPLPLPSLALNLSQYQGLFQWVGTSHQVVTDFAKYVLFWPYYKEDKHASFYSFYSFLNENRRARWFTGCCPGKYQYTNYYMYPWYRDPALKCVPPLSYQTCASIMALNGPREFRGATKRFTLSIYCQNTQTPHTWKIRSSEYVGFSKR